jgi:hypothetical protein
MPHPHLLTPRKETWYPCSVHPITQHMSFPGTVKHYCSSKMGFHCSPISKKQNSTVKMKFEIQNKTATLSASNYGINPNETH